MKHFVVDHELPKSNTSLALLQYRQNNQTYVAPYLSHLQIRGSKLQTSVLKLYLILTNVLCINKVFCWRFFLNSTAFFLQQWKSKKIQEAPDCVYTHVSLRAIIPSITTIITINSNLAQCLSPNIF